MLNLTSSSALSEEGVRVEASELSGVLTIGIDVGTSITKVLVLDEVGNWFYDSWPYPLVREDDATMIEEGCKTLELFVIGLWERLEATLCAASIDLGRIGRIGITAHGPSGILVDEEGRVAGSVITWNDPIPNALLDDYQNRFTSKWLHKNLPVVLPKRGGWPPVRLKQWRDSHNYGVYKSLYPIQLKDLLNQSLTRRVVTDSRSMRGLFDNDNNIPNRVQKWVSLPQMKTPDCLNPNSIVGKVIAKQGGILEGAEVVAGCCDLTASFSGLRCGHGVLMSIGGTSEHLGVYVEESRHNEARVHAMETGLSFIPSIGNQSAILYSATSTGGSTLIKALPPLLGEEIEAVEMVGERLFSRLNNLLGHEIPSEDEMEGVPDFDPCLNGRRGPNPDLNHRGGWVIAESELRNYEPHLLAWRVIMSLTERLEEVRELLLPFIDTSQVAVMGGGLANISQIVTHRNAMWSTGCKKVGGSEVGAFGVALIARGDKGRFDE